MINISYRKNTNFVVVSFKKDISEQPLTSTDIKEEITKFVEEHGVSDAYLDIVDIQFYASGMGMMTVYLFCACNVEINTKDNG